MSALPDYGFKKRRLEVRLTLNSGEFSGGGNTKIINELPVNCSIQKLGPPDFAKADITIRGMLPEDMEAFTTLAFWPLYTWRNYVNIFAGDEDGALTQVFAGSVVWANADYSGMPDIAFKLHAEVGFWGRVTAQGNNVLTEDQDAGSYISSQAEAAGLTFSNEGVTARLSKGTVFNGSPVDKARQAAKQIGAELILDDDEMVLLPRDGQRAGEMQLLSRDTGLLGYPTITQTGVELRCIFNPAFRFAQCFELQSAVPKTNGVWRIIKLTHKLSANDPKDGSWESAITGYYPQYSGAVGRLI